MSLLQAYDRLGRVLRKRLRGLGLWPAAGPAPARADAAWRDSLLRRAPADVSPFLKPLDAYEFWRRTNSLAPAARKDLERALDSRPDAPVISVVMPVHNTRPAHLDAAVGSVLNQIYPRWELCIADDGSTSAETLERLKRIEGSDPRIRITRLETGGGISKATNAAAALATGEVLAFLDHDDVLTADCLAEFAIYYSDHPDADLAYCDDDKIDDAGVHRDPRFKPGWSPVLLLSHMYMGHMLSVRRGLFLELGGFRSAFDGSQDHDFVLRASEAARRVGHIPRILYHWRATAGSTAVSGAAKPGSIEAGRRAVADTLERRGVIARVDHPDWARAAHVGMFQLTFPDEGPEVTIVIPTFNGGGQLDACVRSLGQTRYRNFRVRIIDDGSDDPATLKALDALAREGLAEVVRKERGPGFNFAAMMNRAAAEVTTPLVLFLNDDTLVLEPDWLSRMAGFAGMNGVGAVGARLLFADGKVQHAGVVVGTEQGLCGHAFRGAAADAPGYLGLIRSTREVSAVTAACLLTRTTVFCDLGGFDAEAFAVAYNDVDYGLRLGEAGYASIYCAEAKLVHLEGQTRVKGDAPAEITCFRARYGHWSDFAFNPGLSRDSELFRIDGRRPGPRLAEPVVLAVVAHNLARDGASSVLLDLLAGLKSRGHTRPVVFSPLDGPLRREYEALQIEVRLFEPCPRGEALATYEAHRDALAADIRATGAQVVLANTLESHMAVDAAGLAGVQAIWFQHESHPWRTYFNPWPNTVRTRAFAGFGRAYRVVYVSRATMDSWSPVHSRPNVQVIPHGVPPDRQAADLTRWPRADARAHLGATEDDLVVLIMGTVCRRKGQAVLIEALARLPDAIAGRLRVLITGGSSEPDYLGELTAAIEALPAVSRGRVSLEGHTDDASLYYAASDILVCASTIESAPRVLMEAMAFGLPIISTEVFGIPEVVRFGLNALAFAPNDAQALAERLQTLAADPALRSALSRASPEVLASLPGYDDMIAGHASLIQEAALLRD